MTAVDGARRRGVEALDARAPEGSEDELALAFALAWSRTFLYVPGLGWLFWEGGRWNRDLKRRAFDAMRKIARERAMAAEKELDRKRIAAAKTVAAINTLASCDPRLVRGADDLDADPMALNTPAGIVDLRSGEVHPHDRDLVTKQTAVAPDFLAPCPTWIGFLEDVFIGDRDLIAFVRRFLGYVLTGDTREHVFAFCFGDGANGKSTLLDLLIWLLADYALKLPATVLMAQRGERHPTELAQLRGVRLAVASELDEGAHWGEARLKELTGDETLTARYVRGDFFTFKLLAKIVIAGNHRPQFRAVDDAVRRRLLLVPFAAKFLGDKRDAEMLSKLKAEAPAILAWMIGGCLEWQRTGLQVPATIRAASEEYATTMDSMAGWMADCCRLTGDPLDATKASLLYRSYSDWKRARGEAPVSMTRWAEQMRSRGFESYRSDGVRYRAIDLTPGERRRIEDADIDRSAE